MGWSLWLASGTLAFLIARIIPLARRPWPGELALALLTAFALGVVATALDFGGWRELDPRAGLLCFFASLAILGMLRVATHKSAVPEGRP